MRTGFLFLIFASVAPAQPEARPAHPARGLELDSIAWLEDGAEFLDKRRFKTTLSKDERAFDRDALLTRALEQARQQERPVVWYVYKVVDRTKRGRQMIRAPLLDIAMRQIIWSDPDVERIVKASFVPLRMVADEKLVARFGLRPLEFLEPGLVFFAPDGTVLHVVRTMRTFDASWCTNVLCQVLRKHHGELPKTADLDACKDRGEWERALALLDDRVKPGIRDFYERAVMRRRLRRGAEALANLDAARKTWDAILHGLTAGLPPRRRRSAERAAAGRGRAPSEEIADLAALRADLAAERGRVLAGLGRNDEAVAALRVTADNVRAPRQAEARYLLALLRLRRGDEVGAVRRFQKIVQDHPKSVFARRARANLVVGIDDGRPLGGALTGLERTAWLPGKPNAALPQDTAWAGPPLTTDAVVRHGLQFLLDQQRSDGGYNDSRYAYCPDARITPNVWVAITAVCCQALLRHRDQVPPAMQRRIDDALARGERYLTDPGRMNRGRNEDVYADAYRLLYFAQLHRRSPPEKRRSVRRTLLSIVKDAADRQAEAGFWAHEYDNAFCTAVMVQGLFAARDAGVPVPQTMLDRARAALVSARREDGSFSYGGKARSRRGRSSKKNRQNASTRMAFCETALLQLGGSTPELVTAAFANFWEHYPRIESVRRTDFHSDGQIAGFMFFHTLFHTSHAIAALPPEAQAPEHRRLLERVLRYPEIDATFMDSHEVGRSYGTAMALLVIANALEAER